MDAHAKFDQFDMAHEAALKAIRESMACTDDGVGKLVTWILTADVNPYGFLPLAWASGLSNSIGFASLCRTIHHALVDDGEINFVLVNGDPRISFDERGSEGFEDGLLTPSERSRRDWPGLPKREFAIEYLKGPSEFIEARERFEVETLRKCFLIDASRDLDDAVAHYGANSRFQSEWVEDVAPRVKL